MRRINFFLAVSAFSLLMLCLPAVASAQYGNYDPYGRNGGYGNGQYDPYGRNGGYGNNGDMRSVVRDLKHRAGQFERELDRDLDHGRYNGSRREDDINRMASDFRNAVNRLNSNGRSGDVNQVLNLGYQIDRNLRRARVGSNTQNIWSGIRYDLDALRNANGYQNNRNGGYGTGRINLPSWWPF